MRFVRIRRHVVGRGRQRGYVNTWRNYSASQLASKKLDLVKPGRLIRTCCFAYSRCSIAGLLQSIDNRKTCCWSYEREGGGGEEVRRGKIREMREIFCSEKCDFNRMIIERLIQFGEVCIVMDIGSHLPINSFFKYFLSMLGLIKYSDVCMYRGWI